MLIQTCWIELGRTVKSSDPCRFVVQGEFNHVKGDGGLQDFAGVADVILWNEGRDLIRWNDLLMSQLSTLYFGTRSKREKFLHRHCVVCVVEEAAKDSKERPGFSNSIA